MVGATRIPVLDHQFIGGADNAGFKVVAGVLEPDLVGSNAGQELRDVGVACGGVSFDDTVKTVAAINNISIVAQTPYEGVSA